MREDWGGGLGGVTEREGGVTLDKCHKSPII
jgi:hypothetical protein